MTTHPTIDTLPAPGNELERGETTKPANIVLLGVASDIVAETPFRLPDNCDETCRSHGKTRCRRRMTVLLWVSAGQGDLFCASRRERSTR